MPLRRPSGVSKVDPNPIQTRGTLGNESILNGNNRAFFYPPEAVIEIMRDEAETAD